MNSKRKYILISFLSIICILATLFPWVNVFADELPTADQLFSGNNVTFQTRQDDGTTEKEGLLMTASESGASAGFKLDLQTALNINIKTLNGSVPKFHIKVTDQFGQTFSVYSVYKTSYDDLYVELNGQKGGIYYFSDKWDFVTGYTAGYNSKLESYTQFWRTYSKANRNDLVNTVTADADCLHLRFDPQTMKVGIKRFAPDNYLTIWDLSKQINDGHDMGSAIDYFGDYTFEIVFDEVSNGNGQLLVYSLNGYDFSKENLSEDDITASVSVPFTVNAQVGKEFVFPPATVKTLKGQTQTATTSVGGSHVNSITPTVGQESFTVSYQWDAVVRNYTVPVLSDVSSSLNSEPLPSVVGVNQRIVLPSAKITTDLFRFDAPILSLVSVVDGENTPVELDGNSFVADKIGTYKVTYSALEGQFEKQFLVEAVENRVGINYQQFAEVYRLGHVLSVEKPCITQNGNPLDVVTKLTFPSGAEVANGTVTLSETGDYTLTHSYQSDGEKTFTQTIHVEESAADLFSQDDKVDSSYGVVEGNNDFSGIKLSFEGNRTVAYEKIIDLSDNRFDETAKTGDLLIELVAQPMNIGTSDLERIELFFTDIYDESNVMSVSLAYFPASRTITKIHAKGPNQPYTARRANGEYTNVLDAGFNARHSFIQTVRHDGSSISGEFENYTLKLYYDYEKNALYGTPEWNKDSYLILDFNDPGVFRANPWSGFTDGRVKMTVKVSGVASVADIYVLNIDGSNLNGELFTDTKPPIIEQSISGSMPLAAKGKPYPLIDFNAIDLQSGVSERWWKVTDKNEVTQTITNHAFTPQTTGKYTVTMYAKDYFGNVASKSVTVNAISYVAGVVLSVNGDIPDHVIYGQYVDLPECSTDSGAGQTKVSLTVTKDGNAVPVENAKFFVEEEGTYIVTYKAVDYIGNVNEKSFFIKSTLGGKPSIDSMAISLPIAFVHGETYVFDDYKASFYAGIGASREYIPAVITVTDAEGTKQINGRSYTPVVKDGTATVDTVKVSFVFEKAGYDKLEIEKNVPAVNPTFEKGYMTEYFLLDHGVATAYSDGIVFDSTGAEDMTVRYIRPLNTRNMAISFLTTGAVTEVLTDDQIEALKNALAGAGKRYETVEALDEALEKKATDASGNELDEYVGIEFEGAKYYKMRRYYVRETVINFTNFESITFTLQDALTPSEQVTVTYRKIGTKYVCDIGGKTVNVGINANKEFFLRYNDETRTVSDANSARLGTLTQNDAGKPFTGFSSGSVYVKMTVKGISGKCAMLFKQMNNHTFNNNTRETITPVMWLNGAIDGRYKIGTTATIPTAGAYDVLSTVSIPTVTLTAPNGRVLLNNAMADIEYKLTLGQYGTYMIVYVAKDSADNVITITKSLLVSDERAPTLVFDGEIPATAKVGDTVSLPSYTVVDNKTMGIRVEITFRKPNGQFEIITNQTVVFDKAGVYTVNYFVIDSDRNSNMYSHTIIVTE